MEITPFKDFAARLEIENEERIKEEGERDGQQERSESIRESIQQSEDLQILGPLAIVPVNQSISDTNLLNLNINAQAMLPPAEIHSREPEIEQSKESKASQPMEEKKEPKKKKDPNPKVKERYEKQA